MRNLLAPQLPETKFITDPATLRYAKTLNVELDNLRKDLNKDVGKLALFSYTAAVTLGVDDEVVLCNGTFAVTLPPAASSEGKVYHIKNIGTGVITVDGNDSETIDGGATAVLTVQYESITILSNGTSWYIL